MKTRDIIQYFISLFITIFDLYINYNEKDLPEYHEKRVKFNIYCLLTSALAILYLISFLSGPYFKVLIGILILIISCGGFYYAITSFYVYFSYDGGNKIKSPYIRVMLWISFISFIISFFSGCCKSQASSDNNDSDGIELEPKAENV